MTTATAPATHDLPPAEPGAPAPAPAARPRPRPKHAAIALVVLAVLGAGGFFGLQRLTGGPDTVEGGTGRNTFSVIVPEGWRALSEEDLATQPGKPEAVVRREDGTGFLVVRRAGKAPASLEAFGKDLDKEFAKRIPDFEKRSVRKLKVKAGDALFYSYIRQKAGTVHSVVLVPGPDGSYVLNTVAKGGQDQAARQLGGMIVNFGR